MSKWGAAGIIPPPRTSQWFWGVCFFKGPGAGRVGKAAMGEGRTRRTILIKTSVIAVFQKRSYSLGQFCSLKALTKAGEGGCLKFEICLTWQKNLRRLFKAHKLDAKWKKIFVPNYLLWPENFLLTITFTTEVLRTILYIFCLVTMLEAVLVSFICTAAHLQFECFHSLIYCI